MVREDEYISLENEEKALQEKLREIHTKKKEIEEERRLEKISENQKKIQYMRDNKDVILKLIPHSRTTCSDTNPCNGYCREDGYARCNKCFLIEILEGYYDEFEVSFDLSISEIK